ncbi:hypothetical protein A2U01_0106478, partial [Trifolium medium]|nr:hypothetical protein [Trifolium medium]
MASLGSIWDDFGQNPALGRLAAIWVQPCAQLYLVGTFWLLPLAPSAGHAAPCAG